ncbi:succinate dehydrogenase assembly factor 2 [Amorphus sp. 3PC139-8]|uniref:FAD assembly factor SdhE n=1 Tax=Amorphus sp. 3PC139-8 TaxID=2735676 RepID=UPI00345D7D63
MSGTTRSSAGLDVRRRRLLFHAWHRGTRELDLLLGRFADAAIADLTDDELEAFEALLHVPDPELYGWIAGRTPVPDNWDGMLLRRIISFHQPS